MLKTAERPSAATSRRLSRACAILALALLGSCGAEGAPELSVQHAWARESAPGQTSAAAYLTIVNNGTGADRLLAVASPAARSASLHETSSAGGISRMRPITDGVAVPAGGSARLEPGGRHVMLEGLSGSLEAGASVELRLRFERSGELAAQVRVLSASVAAASSGHHKESEER